MRRPLAFVVSALLAGAVLGATVLREPVAWAAQTVDATIIGPLDANGNVKVHEQGTVQVAGAVGINPGANGVVIENPASQSVPVTVDEPAIERVQQFVTVGLGAGQTDEQEAVYTVPTGKRLIVEFVSARGAAVGDALVLAEVKIGDGLFVPRITLPLSKTRDFGPFSAAEETTLYADAGETVFAHFVHNPGGTDQVSFVAHFTVVGRLVETPTS
jgi:hypothetical protein